MIKFLISGSLICWIIFWLNVYLIIDITPGNKTNFEIFMVTVNLVFGIIFACITIFSFVTM